MSGIDWSKAPSTRHVWLEDLKPDIGGNHSDWGLEVEDWYEFEDGARWYKKDLDTWFRVHQMPQWDGEGLPPVGAVCEWLMDKTWKVVEIRYLSKHTILAALVNDECDDPEFALCPEEQEFRPIRTAEQIAAEERKAGIEQFIQDLKKVNGNGFYSHAEDLYDMGYRKQVQP